MAKKKSSKMLPLLQSDKNIYTTLLTMRGYTHVRPFICAVYVRRNLYFFLLWPFFVWLLLRMSPCLAQILCLDLLEFPIMLLAAKQRVCQRCFHCWESGLRLLSQRYLHRCATKSIIKRLQTFYFLCSIFRMDFGLFVCLLFYLQQICELLWTPGSQI